MDGITSRIGGSGFMVGVGSGVGGSAGVEVAEGVGLERITWVVTGSAVSDGRTPTSELALVVLVGKGVVVGTNVLVRVGVLVGSGVLVGIRDGTPVIISGWTGSKYTGSLDVSMRANISALVTSSCML